MRHRNKAAAAISEQSGNSKTGNPDTHLLMMNDEDDKVAETTSKKKELRFWHWTGYGLWILLIFVTVYLLDRQFPIPVPASDYSSFSEERARDFLTKLTAFGPRTSGSDAMEVLSIRQNSSFSASCFRTRPST